MSKFLTNTLFMNTIDTTVINEFEQVHNKYLDLQKKLPDIIRNKGVKITWLCETTGFPRSTFDRKVKHQNFTPQELKTLARVLNP